MCGHGPRISRSRLSIFYLFPQNQFSKSMAPRLKRERRCGCRNLAKPFIAFFWFYRNFLFSIAFFQTKMVHRVFFLHSGFAGWCVLYILTSKCASRHNGVHFFISHLASWLRTRRFSEPTFRPSGAPNHWKNTVFRDFPTFSHICIFFLLTLSLLIFFLLIFLFSLPLPCSAFHLSILSEV